MLSSVQNYGKGGAMRWQMVRGANTESRFFTVCSVRTDHTPPWFRKVKDGGIPWDIRGVDGFAYFTPKDGTKRVKVPIQIKSSFGGKKHFAEKHSPDVVKNILVIVVSQNMTDAQIRAQLYRALERIRDSGLRFEEFLKRLMDTPIPQKIKGRVSRGASRIRKIRAETE